MAAILRLITNDGLVYADLLNGVLKLRAGLWATRAAVAEGEFKPAGYGAQFEFKQYGTLSESFELFGEGTVSALRTACYKIDQLLEIARRWHLGQEFTNCVWLEWAGEGENARRALIYNGALEISSTLGASPLQESGYLNARLTLTRHPFWEASAGEWLNPGALNCTGGYAAITPTWSYTAPARIYNSILNGVSGSGTLYRIWAGIRENLAGVSDFTSIAECEDGTLGTDAALGSESGASPTGSTTDNKVTVSFSTVTTNAKRVTISLSTFCSGDTDHMIGRYLVLVRCKAGASTTVALEARAGATLQGDPPDTNRPAYLDNTSWRLIEAGEVLFPPTGRSMPSFGCELQLWAERISGSGSLTLDAVILIPSRHLLKIEGADCHYVAYTPPLPNVSYPVHVYRDPNEQIDATADISSGAADEPLVWEEHDWYLPMGGGLLVIACERETEHVLTDELEPQIYIYPRYATYRSS